MIFLLVIANIVVFPVFFTDNAEATVTRIGNQAGYASATGWNSQHMVRTTDGTLHTTYMDGSVDIDYANSTDDGNTWKTVNITDMDESQYRPCIVADNSDNIYIIWGGDHAGQARDQIRYVIHWYANDTWSQVRNVTDVNFVHESPDAEVDEFGKIHLVYMKYDSDSLYCEVMYRNFTQDSGWGSVTQISSGGGTESHELQNIAIDSNNDMHVVWQYWDGSVYNIAYRKYTNSTNSWGSIDVLVTEEWAQSYATMAIDSNNNIHLTWYGRYVGSTIFPQTRYYYYNATSTNWENMQNWTNVAGSQGIGGISVDRSDNAYVSWRGIIDGDYRVRHRNNTGGSWGSIVTIIYDGRYLSGLSSVFPKVDEVSINIPYSGYAFIFTNDSIPYVYFSDDFAFDAPPNTAPTQSGESPTNSITGISTIPSLHVICTDVDSDTMTATWRSNSSEAWVDFATNTSISTGTNITQTNSNFSAYNTIYYWSVNLTDGNGGWTNETYHFTTNVLPTLSGESPTNSSTGISTTPSLHVICTDADSDTMTATWRSNSSGAWVDFATNTSISTGTNITQTNSNFSAYSTTYWWSVNLTDGDEGWDNETYHFTTRSNNTPTFSGESPTNQSTELSLQPTVYVIVSDADADTMTCDFYTSPDDSAWTHRQTNSNVASGTNISYSYIQADTSNTTYYWKVTANDGIAENVTSDIYEFKTMVNWSNIAPVLSNEIPTDGSTGISRLHQLDITVTDADGNNSNVYWYTNASGSWYLMQTNTSVLNTTVRLMSFTNASNFSTKYWWRISANDTHDNTTETYHFTTNVPPTQSGESPTNGSTGASLTTALYVICTDTDDGNIMNATWISNSSGAWVDFATNTSISTGTNITQTNSNFSAYSTTYYWSINLTDGNEGWDNETYYFTVKENVPPALSDESPLHISTDVEIILSQVTVNITDEDTFNWTIGGENITTNSSNDDESGAKNASVIGPLTYYTEYTWWINATDGDEYVNESYAFTTEYLPGDVVYVDDDYTVATEGWHIDKYDSISDALIVVNENGIIYVYAGEYGENLVIPKTVSIVGMTGAYYVGRDSIIVDGDATGNVIAVSANYVNISGLTIKDGDYGIYLNGADYARIIGNVIKDNTDTGIMFENSDNALIKENNFSSSGVWIIDLNSDNIAVYHNNFLDSLPLEDGGGVGNRWNLSYPRGGNYYDDYSATFDDVYQGKGQNVSGSDGLGDNLWNPGRDGKDYYPLFNPYVLGNKRPYVYNSSPVDNIGDVLTTLPSVSIRIEDLEGDSFDWYFETSPDVGSASVMGASNGTIILPITTPLSYFTTITWYVNVTDGGGWTNTIHPFKTESYMSHLFPGSSTPVQDAIDAALSGSTVIIYRGDFEENLVISKSITLIGEDINDTTIDGGGNGDVISITADDVIIQNLTITNSGTTGAPDFDSGIDMGNRSRIQITGSNISNNKYGIHMNGARNSDILNNTIDSNSHSGIYGTDVISSDFSGNYIRENTDYAIHFSSCTQNYVQNNTITGNDYGIHSVTNGSGNVYSDNTISDNTGIGMFLEIENGAVITNSIIASNSHGIVFYNAFPGIHTCDGNLIADNTIASNSGIGIWLHGASSNLICGNNISGNNNKGIDIYWGSKDNDIYENDIYGYDYVNNIPDNQAIGFLVRPGGVGDESCDNFIYHNNFYGNVVQITDSESTETTFSYGLRPNDDEGTNEWVGSDDDGFCLTLRDINFGDDVWSCSDATYTYTSCGTKGMKAYTFDGDSLELVATWSDYGTPYGKIWCDGTFIYVVWRDVYLRAFTFDGTNFELITSFHMEHEGDGIWGDGTYIYVAQKESGFSIYTFDGTKFELSTAWIASAHEEWGNYGSIWGDGTYIYVTSVGIHRYASVYKRLYYGAAMGMWFKPGGGGAGPYQALSWLAQRFVSSCSEYGADFPDVYMKVLTTVRNRFYGVSRLAIYGIEYTYVRHDDIRAFTFDGTSLSYEGGVDVGKDGCTDVWGDGTYIYATCSQNLMAYSFDGTSFIFKGNQEMSDFELEYLWSDESGNVYVTSQRLVGLVSRLSVYTFDGGNFTLMDEVEEELIGNNAVWGNGRYLYITNSMGVFAFTRFGGIPHYRLVNEKIIDYGAEYVYCTPSTPVGSKELYELYDFIPYSTVNYEELESVSITAYIQMESAAGASGSFDFIISDGDNEQSEHHDITLGEDWNEYNSTFLTNPSGGAWDWDDLPTLKIGLALGNGVYADSQPKMTQIYLDFNYVKEQYNIFNDTYPSGGNYFDDFDEESEGAYDRFCGPNQDIPGPDGIVDGNSPNPYLIPGVAGSRDMYPLLKPYSSSVKADFVYTPKNPIVDQKVSFSSTSSGYIVSYEWKFGDGLSAKGSSVFHTFKKEDFYTVTLKVTDTDGNMDSKSKTVSVGSGITGPIIIPPLQPPKYPNNPFSIPEMYQLLRANIPSNSKVVIVTIDSGNYPQTYDGVDLTPIINMFHSSYPDGIDTFGHGTWVNYAVRYGIQTYCPNAIQYSIRAFDERGQSTPNTFLQCLDMAKELNPDIVTISAGIIGTADDVFSKKVGELRRAGIFVTVSAGNEGPKPSTVTSPAIGADSIAVGATDPMLGSILDLSDDEVTEWSSRGPIAGIFPKPDFTAPGESIAGPWLQGEKIASGTSMAAPLVASCVLQIMASNRGLLDAVRLVYGNKLYLDLIETSLVDSAYDKGDPNSYGWGIPNTQLAAQHAWLKAVWYLAVFVLSLVVLMVSIFLVWRWTGGRKKR